MYGSALRDALGWMRNAVLRRQAEAYRHEMMLAYFAGYFVSRTRTTNR
jgi:hypothetical protein